MSAPLLLIAAPAASGRPTIHAARPDADGIALCGRLVAVPRLPHTWRATTDSCTTCRRYAERTR